MPKLTKSFIDSVQVTEKLQEITDSDIRGFGLRVFPPTKRYPNGRKVYFIRTYPRGTGKECRTNIGDASLISIDDARRAARSMLVMADKGQIPTEELVKERKESQPHLSVNDAFRLYIDEHLTTRCSPTTCASNRNRFEHWISPFMGKQEMARVTRSEIGKLHTHVGKTSPGAADRCVQEFSAAWTWCQGMGHIPDTLANPCKRDRRGISGLKSFGPQRIRERTLDRNDIGRMRSVLAEYERRLAIGKKSVHPDFIPLVLALFYSGGRLSELHRLSHKDAIRDGHYLRWEQVEIEAGIIHLPRTKEKKPRYIYMSSQLQNLLREHRVIKEKQGRLDRPVFECSNPGRTWESKARVLMQLEATGTAENFTLHHFRHNFISYAAMAGVPEHIAKIVSGHSTTKDGSAHRGYKHMSRAYLLMTVQKICNALDTLDIHSVEDLSTQ